MWHVFYDEKPLKGWIQNGGGGGGGGGWGRSYGHPGILILEVKPKSGFQNSKES